MGVNCSQGSQSSGGAWGPKPESSRKLTHGILAGFSRISVRVHQGLVLAEITGGSLMGLILLKQLAFYLGLEKATTTDSFHRLGG